MTWCPGCKHARSKFDCLSRVWTCFWNGAKFVGVCFGFCVQSNLSACHTRHRVSRSVVVPGRNTPAPSVQFEFSQFCGVVCAGHDRCALAIKLRQTSAHTHVPTGFAVRKWNFRRSDCTTLDNSLAFSGDGCWRTRCCDVFSSGSGRSVSFGLFEPATSVDLRAC